MQKLLQCKTEIVAIITDAHKRSMHFELECQNDHIVRM